MGKANPDSDNFRPRRVPRSHKTNLLLSWLLLYKLPHFCVVYSDEVHAFRQVRNIDLYLFTMIGVAVDGLAYDVGNSDAHYRISTRDG